MSPKSSASKLDLSLALLVLWVGANHAHHVAPVNHLALVAYLFYRCPYFHDPSLCFLLVAVDDAAARQIVRRKLHGYFVSRENTNKILAHLAGNVRQHLMFVFQLHAEHGVWQRLDDRLPHFDGVLLGIPRVPFLFFDAKLLRPSLPFRSSDPDVPVTFFSGSSVTSTSPRIPGVIIPYVSVTTEVANYSFAFVSGNIETSSLCLNKHLGDDIARTVLLVKQVLF